MCRGPRTSDASPDAALRGGGPGAPPRHDSGQGTTDAENSYDGVTRPRVPMRSVRTFRTGTVAAVIVWKVAALAVLPAALCCQAVMVADGAAVPACCAGGEHGAMCPMKRAPGSDRDADAPQNLPRMIGCSSLDDALIGLLSLTGFTSDVFEWAAVPGRLERIAELRYAAASLVGAPLPPPPRA